MSHSMHVDLFFPFDKKRRHLRTNLRRDLYNLTPEQFDFYFCRNLRRLRRNIAADIDPTDKLIGWRIWRDDVVIAQWGDVK